MQEQQMALIFATFDAVAEVDVSPPFQVLSSSSQFDELVGFEASGCAVSQCAWEESDIQCLESALGSLQCPWRPSGYSVFCGPRAALPSRVAPLLRTRWRSTRHDLSPAACDVEIFLASPQHSAANACAGALLAVRKLGPIDGGLGVKNDCGEAIPEDDFDGVSEWCDLLMPPQYYRDPNCAMPISGNSCYQPWITGFHVSQQISPISPPPPQPVPHSPRSPRDTSQVPRSPRAPRSPRSPRAPRSPRDAPSYAAPVEDLRLVTPVTPRCGACTPRKAK